MRKRGEHTPVLLLTAKDTEDDIVRGIEAGADDYVTKPFGVRELLARVGGLLRRARPLPGAHAVGIGRRRCSTSGRGTLRRRRRSRGVAERPGGEPPRLPRARGRGRIVGREELLVHVWGYRDGTVRTRTVDVHVQQLREKIPRGQRRIATVRGLGYRLEISA